MRAMPLPDPVPHDQFTAAAADGATIRYAIAPCSLGLLLVAATEPGICAIRFGDDADVLRAELLARFPNAVINAVNHRPRTGVKGVHRVSLKHGVSRVRAGYRYSCGIIFHDAA